MRSNVRRERRTTPIIVTKALSGRAVCSPRSRRVALSLQRLRTDRTRPVAWVVSLRRVPPARLALYCARHRGNSGSTSLPRNRCAGRLLPFSSPAPERSSRMSSTRSLRFRVAAVVRVVLLTPLTVPAAHGQSFNLKPFRATADSLARRQVTSVEIIPFVALGVPRLGIMLYTNA